MNYLFAYLKLFVLLLVLFPASVSSQNLVPNPSFDTVLSNNYGSGITNISTDTVNSFHVTDWYRPTLGTPDVLNLNWTGYNFGGNGVWIPNRTTRSGPGMVHQICYLNFLTETYAEPVQCELTAPLEKDSLYYVEYWVRPLRHTRYFVNGFCADVSVKRTWYPYSYAYYVFDTSHIEVIDLGLPKSDTNWMKVSGCFKAKGGEKFLTVGMLLDEHEQTIEEDPNYIHGGIGSSSESNYYFDDVLLTKVPVPNGILDELPEDLLLCEGDSVQNQLPSGYNTYYWSNGSTSNVSNFYNENNDSGWVDVTLGICYFKYEFDISVTDELDENLFDDYYICNENDSVLIDLSCGGCIETWSDFNESSPFYVDQEGSYSVSIDHPCGVIDKTIEVVSLSPQECIETAVTPINVVTPNGDGVNDLLNFGFSDLYSFSLEIYNRWGQVVYSNKNYNNDYSPSDLVDGVYYYILTEVESGYTVTGVLQKY